MKNWNYGKILGYAVAVLSFGACIGYTFVGDWRRASYWFFAGCISISVTV